MQIGFIGFGEASFCIADGLKGEGVSGMTAYDTMSDDAVMGGLIQRRAKQSGVRLVESAGEVAQSADVLFMSVPSIHAWEACLEVVPHLHEGQIVADVCASTPAVKGRIWEQIEQKGVLFVDAAMLGSLPQDKHRVPISASGNGATAFRERMEPLGMRITTVGERAGEASALKLVRSIFMKGIAALMVEMLEAADAYGVSDQVIDSVGKSMDGIPFVTHLDRLVSGTAIHAVRRAAELKGSIEMCDEASLDHCMTDGAKQKHETLGTYNMATLQADAQPKTWRDVIKFTKNKDKEGPLSCQ